MAAATVDHVTRDVLALLPTSHRVARAQRDDLAAIVALLAADPLGSAREDSTAPAYARAFEAIDRDPAQLLVVALDEADTIVGTLQLSLIPGLSRQGALRAQIESVRVGEPARGSGLGTALLEWSIDHARAQGAGLVQLTTDKSRTRARDFYERLGFIASHEGMKLTL